MQAFHDDLQQTHETTPLTEVNHIPLWVKGMVAAGIILSLIQLCNFRESLNDAVKKERAISAYKSENFIEAIALYSELAEHYPNDKNLLKFLGLSHYKVNHFHQAMSKFELLEGKQMLADDVTEIDAAISDMVSKLEKIIKERD